VTATAAAVSVVLKPPAALPVAAALGAGLRIYSGSLACALPVALRLAVALRVTLHWHCQ
jgi:hypothetical protein